MTHSTNWTKKNEYGLWKIKYCKLSLTGKFPAVGWGDKWEKSSKRFDLSEIASQPKWEDSAECCLAQIS